MIRAAEGVRATIRLGLRDFTRSREAMHRPTAQDLERMTAAAESAWELYGRHRLGSLTAALDALAGVRAALADMAAVGANRADTVEADLFGGAVIEVSLRSAWDIYRVPPELRDPAFTVVATLSFDGTPDVEVSFGGRTVWTTKEGWTT